MKKWVRFVFAEFVLSMSASALAENRAVNLSLGSIGDPPGLTHEIGLEKLEHVIVVLSRSFAFATEADFSGAVLTHQVDGDLRSRFYSNKGTDSVSDFKV